MRILLDIFETDAVGEGVVRHSECAEIFRGRKVPTVALT